MYTTGTVCNQRKSGTYWTGGRCNNANESNFFSFDVVRHRACHTRRIFGNWLQMRRRTFCFCFQRTATLCCFRHWCPTRRHRHPHWNFEPHRHQFENVAKKVTGMLMGARTVDQFGKLLILVVPDVSVYDPTWHCHWWFLVHKIPSLWG